MIRRRGYGFPKRPQYVTGHTNRAPSVHGEWSLGDRAPLVPETPIDIAPRPNLPSTAPAAPVAAKLVAPDALAPPAAIAPVAAAPPPPLPKPTNRTTDIVAQPDQTQKRAQNERGAALDYSQLGVAKLRKVYDLIGRVLSDRGVPPPEPQFPRMSRNRTGRTARSGASKTKTHSASTRDHHSRHCTICNHPERAAIEEEFVHWHDPSAIGLDYEVGRRSVYRHAHAAGLFARRERNMRFALGHMVQQAMNITPTSDSILRAIRAYSCLNRRGQWTEPASHVIVSSGTAAFAAQRALCPALVELPAAPPDEAPPPKKNLPQKSGVTRHCVPSRKERK